MKNDRNGEMKAQRSSFLSRTTALKTIISASTTIPQLHQSHAQIISSNLRHDLPAVTKLAQKLLNNGAAPHAFTLLSTFPNPDVFLFNIFFKFLSLSPHPSPLLHLHALSILHGFSTDIFLASSIVNLYSRLSILPSAHKTLHTIPSPDTVLWNSYISGLAKNSHFPQSVQAFLSFMDLGMKIDSATLISVLPAVAEIKDAEFGMAVHGLAFKVSQNEDMCVLTCLISVYSNSGKIILAAQVFDDMLTPDLIACNSLLRGFSTNGEVYEAARLFRNILWSRRMDGNTVVALIPLSSPFGYLDFIHSVHGFSVKSGFFSSSSVSTAFITVYSRIHEMGEARSVFNENDKCLEGWNAMISGYSQIGMTEEAISLFKKMKENDIKPNPLTATSILSACAQLGTLSIGRWVHEVIVKQRMEMNVFVWTALVDMYAKCGRIHEAVEIFTKITDKNVVTWNVMICAFGLHGLGGEALRHFYGMQRCGVSPNKVTFLCVMNACSHAGMVSEGRHVFHLMVEEHGLEPMDEHYACMVDLFGRAGRIDEALGFIKEMSAEAGSAVWATMLGACMVHGEKRVGGIAWGKLFELDPRNSSHCVLISNIYSVGRSYGEAAEVRRSAGGKVPGCTVIEVGGEAHVFRSGEWAHPWSEGIYCVLEKLMGKMREAGFTDETVGVAVHDVEEEEKGMMVRVHSEKLAVAFGIMATEEGSEIRIVKNLRICVDCHNAMKFISKLVSRSIVVRDVNRFHHFGDGVCSCGDYW